MQTVDLIISARWIIPVRPREIVLKNHSIIINQGKILAILPDEKARAEFCAKELKLLENHVVMPGLVNAHTHSPMVLYRGMADDLALMDWLTKHIWPAEGALTNAESIQAGMRLACAEMIRGGTTCFNEMYFFPNETAEIVVSAGMRACIGHTIMNVPTGWAKDENEYIAKAKNAYKNSIKSDLISWSVAPHATYTNSDKSLALALELAEELNAVINIHLQESASEITMSLEQFGKRPLQRLLDINFLNDRIIAVHMVHLIDEEIALCREKNISIAHCPVSNLKLASGFAPIAKYLKANINVAIGTDGAASNNSLDLWAEVKTAAILAKAVSGDPTTLPAFQAIEMATINGAKALKLDHEIGSLEAGKSADLIAIDFAALNTEPVYNPISHLAYAMNSRQVSNVWVKGKTLLSDGELTTLDSEKITAAVRPWQMQAAKFQRSK